MFLNRVYPLAGESRCSLLCRLASENYLYLTDLVKVKSRKKASLYIDNRNYSTGSEVDEAIDEVVRWVAPDISNLLLNKFDTVMFPTVPSDYERKHVYFRTGVKFCPMCLQKSLHHRLVWDVTWKTVCVKHQAYLISKCPACSRKIYPSKLMTGKCECDVDFAHIAPERPSGAVLETQSVIDDLLERRTLCVTIREQEFPSQKFFQSLYVLSRLFDGFPSHHPLFKDLDELNPDDNIRFLVQNKGNRDSKTLSALATAAYRFLLEPEKYFFDVYRCMRKTKRRSGNDFQIKARWLKAYINAC